MSGVEKKGEAKEAKEENTMLGPRAKEGEHVYAVAHIYASFNDTFVHVSSGPLQARGARRGRSSGARALASAGARTWTRRADGRGRAAKVPRGGERLTATPR